jgi:outer membrane protein assembly factor BamB
MRNGRRVVVCCLGVSLLLHAYSAAAQNVYRQQRVIGSHLSTGNDIYAEVFTFSDRVEHSFYDPERQVLSAVLRGLDRKQHLVSKGLIEVYNLRKDSPAWQRKVRFYANSIFQPNGYFVENRGLRTTVSRIADGMELWRAPYETYFVNDALGLAMAYNTQGSRNDSDVLEGIDLLTGKRLWQRNIPRTFGWNEVQQLDDSLYLVLAAGVHLINVKSGAGWSYYTKTGERYTGNVVSNVLSEEGDYYIASKVKIARIDANDGAVKWSSRYPDDLASSSVIFSDDSTVYMLNTGIASSYFGPRLYGKPFFAAYRKSTGTPRYFVQVEDPDEPIYDHLPLGDAVLMLRKGKLEAYAKTDGKRRALHTYTNDDEYGMPLAFLPGREVYTKQPDGRFAALAARGSSLGFVHFNSGQVMAIDAQLERVYDVDLDGLWILSESVNGLDLLVDGERTMVINEEGRLVAELLARSGTLYPDHTLLYHDDVQCFLINLQKVLAAGEVHE